VSHRRSNQARPIRDHVGGSNVTIVFTEEGAENINRFALDIAA
jgi:hypothetical protein